MAEEEGFDSARYGVGTRWYALVRYIQNARNKQFTLDRLNISFWRSLIRRFSVACVARLNWGRAAGQGVNPGWFAAIQRSSLPSGSFPSPLAPPSRPAKLAALTSSFLSLTTLCSTSEIDKLPSLIGGPGRNHPSHPGVGDELAHVFVGVNDDPEIHAVGIGVAVVDVDFALESSRRLGEMCLFDGVK